MKTVNQQIKDTSHNISAPAQRKTIFADSLPAKIYFFYTERTNCKGYTLRRFPRVRLFDTLQVAKARPAVPLTIQSKKP
ncbi:MAG TPA: hypothetical protein VK645_15995, partial [Chitinophagaceae bacterium]|nr:hypothetical protein [Chitinophagaceae bacterium]